MKVDVQRVLHDQMWTMLDLETVSQEMLLLLLDLLSRGEVIQDSGSLPSAGQIHAGVIFNIIFCACACTCSCTVIRLNTSA